MAETNQKLNHQPFQSPEGEVLTVQHIARKIGKGFRLLFQSPEGEVLTVQRPPNTPRLHPPIVSVPRRGSADGATNPCLFGVGVGVMFQSPEGEVLTVQLEARRK